MPKVFRFLVTIPAASAPSPVAADVREEVDYLLRRHMNGVIVKTLKKGEGVYPLRLLGPSRPITGETVQSLAAKRRRALR